MKPGYFFDSWRPVKRAVFIFSRHREIFLSEKVSAIPAFRFPTGGVEMKTGSEDRAFAYRGRVRHRTAMRAFLAILPDEDSRAHLAKLRDSWMEHLADKAKPVPDSNLHLTLAFLGETDQKAVETVVKSLTGLKLPAVTLKLDSSMCFPNITKATVLTVGAKKLGDPFLSGVSEIHGRLRKLGFEIELRRFHAHVTLARFARATSLRGRVFPVPSPISYTAARFHLMKSTTGKGGTVYEELCEF